MSDIAHCPTCGGFLDVRGICHNVTCRHRHRSTGPRPVAGPSGPTRPLGLSPSPHAIDARVHAAAAALESGPTGDHTDQGDRHGSDDGHHRHTTTNDGVASPADPSTPHTTDVARRDPRTPYRDTPRTDVTRPMPRNRGLDRRPLYPNLYDNALVADSAHLGDDAIAQDNAIIAERATVVGTAAVSGDAYIGGYARVVGDAHISGTAEITGRAHVAGHVFGDARISGTADVPAAARVGDHADLTGPDQCVTFTHDGLTYTAYRAPTAAPLSHCGDQWGGVAIMAPGSRAPLTELDGTPHGPLLARLGGQRLSD